MNLRQAIDAINPFLKTRELFRASKITLKEAVGLLQQQGHKSGMTPVNSTPVRGISMRLTNLSNVLANSENGSPRNSGTKNEAADDEEHSDEQEDDEEHQHQQQLQLGDEDEEQHDASKEHQDMEEEPEPDGDELQFIGGAFSPTSGADLEVCFRFNLSFRSLIRLTCSLMMQLNTRQFARGCLQRTAATTSKARSRSLA